MAEDPRQADSEPRLVARIREEIEGHRDRRITFARFMERALTEPELGYYASSELRPTREGDFLTAAELHPIFGRCIGRFVADVWAQAGSPPTFRIHEYGGGRGTLRDDATAELEFAPGWQVLDLPHQSDEPRGQADLVIANEYLDALPVHRVVQDTVLQESYVTWADAWFAEVTAEPASPDLVGWLAADGVALKEQQRAEICLAMADWAADVGASLAPGGVLLVIDYGHEADELFGERRMAGSLLTYRGHQVDDDPFAAVGRSDITTHVDLTALRRHAQAAGLKPIGSTTQGRFLSTLGLGEDLSSLGRRLDADPADYVAARAAVVRLLDPRHLGGFHALAWARPQNDGTLPALRGFESGLQGST